MTEQPGRVGRAMKERSQLPIEGMPEDVREAVDGDARAEARNRNDVMCEILAARFKIPYEPTGYPYKPRAGDSNGLVMLRLPADLRAALRQEADRLSAPGRKIAQARLVVAALQSHYGLIVDSPRRRSAVPPIDAEIVRQARARHEAGESLRSLAAEYDVKRDTLTKAIRGGGE